MHALSEKFDATELRQAPASLETIDLRALAFGPDLLRSASTTGERVTHLHIPVPAITRGTLAHTHELKLGIVSKCSIFAAAFGNIFNQCSNLRLFCLPQ